MKRLTFGRRLTGWRLMCALLLLAAWALVSAHGAHVFAHGNARGLAWANAQATPPSLSDTLVVGVPYEDIQTIRDAGTIHVMPGSVSGLTVTSSQEWNQSPAEIEDAAEPDDKFGYALAAGDFNNDGFPDLAIGIPFEDINGRMKAGAVQVLYGIQERLTAVGNQWWHQDKPGIDGAVESSDSFGRALATGDFNGDGYTDLAIGVPGEKIETEEDAGAVQIIYGSDAGLTAAGNQWWHQESPDIEGSAAMWDFFGEALAAGDFNGDGYTDLAIGIPGEDVGGANDAGAVEIIYGSERGLVAAGDQLWTQDSPGMADMPEVTDSFGSALAAGDFNGDGYADLAIGVPNEDIGGFFDAGIVHVLYGSEQGLTTTGSQWWYQNTPGVEEQAENGDRFGYALTTGDFNRDGYQDLAIGVPHEDLPGALDAGVVQVLYGSAQGLTAAGNQVWIQGQGGLQDSAEGGDHYGYALAAGDFNGDEYTDLAVGAPGEDVEGVVDAGAVQVIYGSSQGLASTGNQVWHQNSPGLDDNAEPMDRFGYALVAMIRPRHKTFMPILER